MDFKKLKGKPLHTQRKKRVGRGTGSGMGKTCTRGEKGARARTGYSVRATFEGGQMPLVRRLPKRGFSNVRFADSVGVVNVGDLNGFEEGATVDPKALAAKGLLKGRFDAVRILGSGDLKVRLEVKAHGFSKSAEEKIKGAKGTATVIRG